VPRDVLPHLEALSRPGRKVDLWYATLKIVEVRFDDEEEAFRTSTRGAELQDLSEK